MDGATKAVKEKLDRLVKEAAAVSVALDRANGTIEGVPHYSKIESRAHDLGQQLSREIQIQQMGHISAQSETSAKCPACGTRCELVHKKRRVTSIDGSFEFEDLMGQCPHCRRAFFPPPRDIGL
jgi:hypothetical protein